MEKGAIPNEQTRGPKLEFKPEGADLVLCPAAFIFFFKSMVPS